MSPHCHQNEMNATKWLTITSTSNSSRRHEHHHHRYTNKIQKNTLRSVQHQVVFKLVYKQWKSLKKLEHYMWPDFPAFFIPISLSICLSVCLSNSHSFFLSFSLSLTVSPSYSFIIRFYGKSKRYTLTHIYKLTITHCDNLTHKFLIKNGNDINTHSLFSISPFISFWMNRVWDKSSKTVVKLSFGFLKEGKNYRIINVRGQKGSAKLYNQTSECVHYDCRILLHYNESNPTDDNLNICLSNENE